MRAEVQHRMGREVLAQVAVKSREGMRGGHALFEQQAHRVAFIAEGRLDTDQHIAELPAQHKDAAAVAELSTGRSPPLGLDLLEPAFATHMVVGPDHGVHIGVGAVLTGIAVQQRLTHHVEAFRQFNPIALRLHHAQRVPE